MAPGHSLRRRWATPRRCSAGSCSHTAISSPRCGRRFETTGCPRLARRRGRTRPPDVRGKRARGGSAGLAPPGSPTHVILTDRADADTRALAARQHPAAILVTQTWVFDRLAGKPEAPPPESSPPPTSAPSANPTSRLPLAAPASDDDVLPPDHPNWILDARVSNRAFDASDGVRLGARVGATMDSVERCLRCRHDRDASLNEPVVALLVELERYEHLGARDRGAACGRPRRPRDARRGIQRGTIGVREGGGGDARVAA